MACARAIQCSAKTQVGASVKYLLSELRHHLANFGSHWSIPQPIAQSKMSVRRMIWIPVMSGREASHD